MAEVVSTIVQAGGGDYTSISAWEAATNLNGGTDIWHGVISDNAAYDEAVIIDGGGTNNTSSYVKLSVDPANRHAGKWDTGKARLAYSGADTAVVELNTNYVMVEGLQVFRPSTGSIGNSDEGIRVASGASDGCLISRCLIWTDNHTNSPDTDGIYLGNWAINSLYLDHCILYGWERAGLHAQQFNNSGGNQTIVIDYSTFAFCGNAGGEAPISVRQENGATTVTVWNTVLRHHQDRVWADLGIDDGSTGDSVTVEGGNNTYGTISELGSGVTTFNWVNNNVQSSSSIVDTDTAGDIIVVDATSNPVTAATDLTLQDLANNVALLTGTNRIGSEPDPRQDFSVDLAGNARSATSVDPGPLQVSPTGPVFSSSQTDWRGFNDDGDETSSTPIAATNTDWSHLTDQAFRVRFVLTGATAAGSIIPQLQFRLNAGPWLDVDGASTAVKPTTSTHVTDGEATTQRVGSGPFVAGSVSTDGLGGSISFDGSGQETEVEFVVFIDSTEAPEPNAVEFRVTNAGSPLDSYATFPEVTSLDPPSAPFPHVSADFGSGLIVPLGLQADFGAGPVTPTSVIFVSGYPPIKSYQGFAAGVTGGQGQTEYTVTTLADSGVGSLRDALSAPNRLIKFDSGLSGTITLTTELFADSTDNVTLWGNGLVTIAGQRVRFTDTDNLLVANMIFDGSPTDSLWLRSNSGAARTTSHVFVGCEFLGAANNAINASWAFTNDFNLTVAHCKFAGLRWAAIVDGGSTNEGGVYSASVHDCWFDDVWDRQPLINGAAGHKNHGHCWNNVYDGYGEPAGAGGGVKTGYESHCLVEYCVATPRDNGTTTAHDGSTVTSPRTNFSQPGTGMLGPPGIHENIGNILNVSGDGASTATESSQTSAGSVSIPYTYTLDASPDAQQIRDAAGA